MRHTNDPDAPSPDPAIAACLSRTRKAVLDVLVGVGFLIAVSGGLIRRRAGGGPVRPPRGLHDGLLFALLFVAAGSYLVRRRWSLRPASLPPDRQASRFYRSHVGAAAVAALGVPLGLAYGRLVDPRLEGVAPFWVVPIALGLLAFPRRGELDDLDASPPIPRRPDMTGTQAAILWIYSGIVAIWPIRYAVLSIILRGQRSLDERSPRYREPDPPLVTAILPAKDEETYISDCLDSIRAQAYPNLEIVVVDDRSADRTGEIARDHAGRDPRVRVLTIEALPPGWTGKTHALHRAVAEASGEWLWFLDADTLHAPDALSILMEYGRSEGAAMISLLPELRCETFWERVVQPLGGIVLMQSFPLHVVHRDDSPMAFANGQDILIRRDAYAAAGGHEAVKGRFVEDIGLAGQVKRKGYRIRVALIRGIVTCRMYASLGQLVRGWSRILYDALDRRAGRLAIRLLDVLVFCQTGHVALAAGLVLLALGSDRRFALALTGLAILHHVLMFFVFRLIYRTSVPRSRHAGWYPLGNLIVDVILVRAIRMCLTGRVNWRDTQYGPTAGAAGRAEAIGPRSRVG